MNGATGLLTILFALAGLALAKKWIGARAYDRWIAPRARRQITVLERVALTNQHAIHLLAIRGRWLAVATSPSGCQVLDSGIEQPSTEVARAQAA